MFDLHHEECFSARLFSDLFAEGRHFFCTHFKPQPQALMRGHHFEAKQLIKEANHGKTFYFIFVLALLGRQVSNIYTIREPASYLKLQWKLLACFSWKSLGESCSSYLMDRSCPVHAKVMFLTKSVPTSF